MWILTPWTEIYHGSAGTQTQCSDLRAICCSYCNKLGFTGNLGQTTRDRQTADPLLEARDLLRTDWYIQKGFTRNNAKPIKEARTQCWIKENLFCFTLHTTRSSTDLLWNFWQSFSKEKPKSATLNNTHGTSILPGKKSLWTYIHRNDKMLFWLFLNLLINYL